MVIDFPQGDAETGASYADEPLWSPDGQWIAWKMTSGVTAKWEGAHPNGTARGDLFLVGGQVDWQPCASGCESIFPGWTPPVPPTLSIGDATVTEGDAGTVTATFTIARSGTPSALAGDSSAGFATSSGTANAGADFDHVSGQVAFAAGETTKTISVAVHGDGVDEPHETFAVYAVEPDQRLAQLTARASGRFSMTIRHPPPVAAVPARGRRHYRRHRFRGTAPATTKQPDSGVLSTGSKRRVSPPARRS